MTLKACEQIDRMKCCEDRKCKYLSTYTYTCDYILIKGVRRPCPPGEECTAWKDEKAEVKKPVPPFPVKKVRKERSVINRNHFERMWKLYQQGLNDREIAEDIGCCRTVVGRWRHRNSLLPNDKRRRE